MRVHLQQSSISDLPGDTYRVLSYLNLKWGGRMQESVRYARRKKDETQIFYLTDDQGKVLAWMMLLARKSPRTIRREVHAYTRKDFRRRGYGYRLLRAVNTFCGKKGCKARSRERFFRRAKERGNFSYVVTN